MTHPHFICRAAWLPAAAASPHRGRLQIKQAAAEQAEQQTAVRTLDCQLGR